MPLLDPPRPLAPRALTTTRVTGYSSFSARKFAPCHFAVERARGQNSQLMPTRAMWAGRSVKVYRAAQFDWAAGWVVVDDFESIRAVGPDSGGQIGDIAVRRPDLPPAY
jgi:hypothetical protein